MARAGETRRRLSAGPLTAELDGLALADVRVRGALAISRVFVTVRDAAWRTVEPVLRNVRVHGSPEGPVVVDVEALHDDGELTFAWSGTFRLSGTGEVRFDVAGAAERTLRYRRIGICVLLPWRSTVGGTFSTNGVAGPASGSFPQAIAPQLFRDGSYRPMIPAFSDLDVHLPSGVDLAFSFEGDAFELEDQRNWTDGSFKIYPTPLERSVPRPLPAGETLAQRMRIDVDASTLPVPPALVDEERPVAVRIGRSLGHRMPPIGVSAPARPIGTEQVAALRELRPSHVRVEVRPDVDDDATIGASFEAGRSTGVPFELALLVDEAGTAAERLAPFLNGIGLARLLVHRLDGVTTSSETIRAVRDRMDGGHPGILAGVRVAGGTWSSFSELNREPPDPEGIDAVALAMSPRVHARDERSMLSTLEIQGSIVRQLRAAIGRPVVVSPMTLAVHDPFAPLEIDERVAGSLGAAWTLGSLGHLAAAGVASVTVHEAVDRTMLSGDPPARVVAAWATRLRGMELMEVDSTDPGRVFGLAGGGVALLANLTDAVLDAAFEVGPRSRTVTFGPYETILLDAEPSSAPSA